MSPFERQSATRSIPLTDRYDALRQKDQLHLFGKQEFLALIAQLRGSSEMAEALTVSEEALRIHLLDGDLLQHRCDLLLENQRPGEALETLELLEQTGGDEISLVCLRARAMFQLGEGELARVLLRGLRQWAPESRKAEVLLLEAALLAKSGLKEEAYHAYKEVLLADPRNREALERIWLASESARMQKDSLAFHTGLIDRDPYNGMAWFNAGQAHYYLLRYEEALEAFEYAGMLEPNFSLTFCFAAEVALAIGQPKRALKNLYDILQRSVHDAGLHKLTGQAYLAMDNLPKARQYYLMARNLDPLDDENYYHLGRIYLRERKPGIAARYFERAVNLDDRNEDYVAALADAWMAEGRADEAEACLVRATELAPELPEGWVRYAEFMWRQDRWDAVLEITAEAGDHTWDAGICFIRAAALFRLGQRAEALRSMEEALEEDYDQHEQFFRYLPDYRKDKDVKAILRYFAMENA